MEPIIEDYVSPARRVGAALPVEKVPPHSEEIEATVLGKILYWPKEVAQDIERLGINAQSFYVLRHQTIFKLIKAVMRDKLLPDLMTVSQRARDEGKLQEAGDLGYLMGLPDFMNGPFEQYVQQLHELRKRRQVIRHAACVQACAHDPLEPLDSVATIWNVCWSSRVKTKPPL